METSQRDSSDGYSDDESMEEVDEEIEPKLKYERIGNGMNTIMKKDSASCLAVHSKFLALGTKWGLIYIMDHSGNIIDKKIDFTMHITAVNHISIDNSAEYIASCSEDGNVIINGLYTSDSNQVVNFDRPVRAVAIDPNYSKLGSARQFITGHNQLILHERGFLKRLKTQVLAPSDSCIHNIQWKGAMVAWAVDKGVYVYDLALKKLARFMPRQKSDAKFTCGSDKKQKRQRCVLNWIDDVTLIVARDNFMQVCVIKDATKESVSKQPEIVRAFDFSIAGLCPFHDVIVILSCPPQQDTSLCKPGDLSRPHLRIIEDCSGDELSNDALSIRGFQTYKCLDYTLENYSEEGMFYIISPKDVVVARQRDSDDHLHWLIEHERFQEALDYAKENVKSLKRITVQEVGFHWFNNLYNDNNFHEAASICACVLGRSKELWESYVVRFEQVNQLQCLTPYLPTSEPQLEDVTYQRILEYFLYNDEALFQSLLRDWSHPVLLYDVKLMLHLAMEKLEEDRDNIKVLEALGFLYTLDGNFKKSLYIFIKLGHKDVFDLISRHDLFDVVDSQLMTLMTFDPDATVTLLVENVHRIPVAKVVSQLDTEDRGTSIYLHSYLCSLFSKDKHVGRMFHQRQVELFAEHEPDKLLSFLKSNCNVSLQESYKVCQRWEMVKEMVYLLDIMGNRKEALHLTLNQHQGPSAAIDFCKQHTDEDLWKQLISHSIDKPEYIKALLNTVGAHIDPILLISQIHDHMSISGLRDSLVKILHDFTQQISLQKCCSKLVNNDSLHLFQQLLRLHKSGLRIDDEVQCPECLRSIITSSNGFMSFFCEHIFHTECIMYKDLTTCPVCSEANNGKFQKYNFSVT